MASQHNDRQLALLLKNDPARGLEAALDRYGGAVKVICAAILGEENRQEVEEAMDAARLSPMDFAGLARVRLPDGSEGYALGYGGFSALNTYMIQYLDKRVSRLEERNERDQTAS